MKLILLSRKYTAEGNVLKITQKIFLFIGLIFGIYRRKMKGLGEVEVENDSFLPLLSYFYI